MKYTLKTGYKTIIETGYQLLLIEHEGKTYEIELTSERTLDERSQTYFTFKNETSKRTAFQIGFVLNVEITRQLEKDWITYNDK